MINNASNYIVYLKQESEEFPELTEHNTEVIEYLLKQYVLKAENEIMNMEEYIAYLKKEAEENPEVLERNLEIIDFLSDGGL